MRDVVITLIVFGAIPLILMRPHIGVYMWAWLSYMNPHRLTWGFAYNMPFAQVTGIATLASLLFSKERKSVPWTPTTVIWVSWVAWMCVTTLFALEPQDARPEWERAMKIQLMTLVTLLTITTRERLLALVTIIVGSIGFYGIKGGIFTVLTGGNYLVWGPAKSFIEGNNELAFALIICLPLMRYLQTQTKNRWLRWGILAAMGLCAASIVGSHSRGALLAGAAMGAGIWWKSRQKILIGLVMVVLLAGVVATAPDEWFDRMSTIKNYEQDASARGRINSWWFAFNLAVDSPFVGGGFNVFSPELFFRYAPEPDNFHDAHSIYFEVLAEHGFVGLGLFLGLGALTLLTGTRIIRRCRDHPDLDWASELAKMAQVSVVGYAVGGAFLGLAYFDLYYHLVAILVLTDVIVGRQVAPSEKRVKQRLSGPRLASVVQPEPAEGSRS